MNMLITNLTNIRYLTGFVGVDKRDAYLLLTKNKKYLFTSSLYLEVAKKLKDVELVEISKEKSIEKEVAKIAETVGFEEQDLTVSEYNLLKKTLRLVPTKNRIEKLRMIKREDEIENIRTAAKLTDQCFNFILGKLKPGVTETEIAWEIQRFLGGIAFSPIVAFGKNSSMPHYQTLDTRLQTSDLILLDFGAKVNGYCSDMTRVVFLGKPKDEWVKAYNAIIAAQKTTLDALPRVTSGAKLDSLAKSIIKQSGFTPYQHSLGHNVGLDIHEAPRLTTKKPFDKLKAGMVFTIEPGIYIEGQYGIRIEDLVLLNKDSIEILSKSPKELIVL